VLRWGRTVVAWLTRGSGRRRTPWRWSWGFPCWLHRRRCVLFYFVFVCECVCVVLVWAVCFWLFVKLVQSMLLPSWLESVWYLWHRVLVELQALFSATWSSASFGESGWSLARAFAASAFVVTWQTCCSRSSCWSGSATSCTACCTLCSAWPSRGGPENRRLFSVYFVLFSVQYRK